MKSKISSVIIGFFILFALYHAAEWMFMKYASVEGFLGFQISFFVAAYLIGKKQFGNGLKAWGFDFKNGFVIYLVPGLLMGLLLYSLTFYFSMQVGAEKLVKVPDFSTIVVPLGLFVFGNWFSSFSEDVFVRAYVVRHLENRISPIHIVWILALIYVLNHIYRLTDGVETYIYIFALGGLCCALYHYEKDLVHRSCSLGWELLFLLFQSFVYGRRLR